uniref:LRAT domain-containing protein n=1 Tax=Globodera pallida TaxID=36090 RepID=A0A183CBF3_GLOPA
MDDILTQTFVPIIRIYFIAIALELVHGAINLDLLNKSNVAGPFLAMGAIVAQVPTLIQDLTHEALEVLYKCRSCGHEVHVTYEILAEGEVRNDPGRYTKTYPPSLYSTNLSFVDIERVYRSMWTDYNMVYNNCKHWTNGITKRIYYLVCERSLFW